MPGLDALGVKIFAIFSHQFNEFRRKTAYDTRKDHRDCCEFSDLPNKAPNGDFNDFQAFHRLSELGKETT